MDVRTSHFSHLLLLLASPLALLCSLSHTHYPSPPLALHRYVQDRLAENAEELFERLDKGGHIYFCGLKGMMPGIIETLQQVAEARGVNWEGKLEELKKAGQWHVEVY